MLYSLTQIFQKSKKKIFKNLKLGSVNRHVGFKTVESSESLGQRLHGDNEEASSDINRTGVGLVP